MSSMIKKLLNHFIFSEPDFPNEDDVIEEIKTSTLDELYNYRTSYYNDSLLHIAVYYNQNKIVKALLDKKFYVDFKNNNYETPLHYACIYNRFNWSADVVETLIKHGANVNAVSLKTTYGSLVMGNHTPIQYAMMKSDNFSCMEVIQCLVKHGAYVTFHTKTPRTIEEHSYTEEQSNILIDMKWSFMRETYEKQLDYNLHMVISNYNKAASASASYIPKELVGAIRSYMDYSRDDIIQIIREMEENI